MCGLKSKTWFYRFYCNFYPFTQATEFEEGTSHSEDTSSDSLVFLCVSQLLFQACNLDILLVAPSVAAVFF